MPADNSYTLTLADETATTALAARLAHAVLRHVDAVRADGFNLRLNGNLGAGKTTFTRAFLRALNFTGRVKSPTFELVEDYDVAPGVVLHHFDFYRFEEPTEFEDAGFRDLFGAGQIVFSEWSEKAEPYLPEADLEINLTLNDALSRTAEIAALTEFGSLLLKDLAS